VQERGGPFRQLKTGVGKCLWCPIRHFFAPASPPLEELQKLDARLASSPDEGLKLLAGLREWDEISRHDFWGYRRFAHGQVSDQFAAGTIKVTPAMEALCVYSGPRGHTGTLRLLATSSDETTSRSAARMMAQFAQSSPGIWQATVQFTGDDDLAMRTIIPMSWLFGLGNRDVMDISWPGPGVG
jgi:hypothetical protein